MFPRVMNFPGNKKLGTLKTTSISPQRSVVASVRPKRLPDPKAPETKEEIKETLRTDTEMKRMIAMSRRRVTGEK